MKRTRGVFLSLSALLAVGLILFLAGRFGKGEAETALLLQEVRSGTPEMQERPAEATASPEAEKPTQKRGVLFSELYAGCSRPLVTADAAAELFIRQLSCAAGLFESTFLYDQYVTLFVDLTDNLERRFDRQREGDRGPARDALFFSALGTALLLPEARIPVPVLSEVREEVEYIRKASFIGQRRGRPRDYTIYALDEGSAGSEAWRGKELLTRHLNRFFFPPGDEAGRKRLWLLADCLFQSPIAKESYLEIRRYRRCMEGLAGTLDLFDLYCAQTNALARSGGASGGTMDGNVLPEPGPEVWREMEARALTSFDAPPWKDPAHVSRPEAKIFFLSPGYAPDLLAFRELHRWAVLPRLDHLLHVLGRPSGIGEAEAALLDALGGDSPGEAGIWDRTAKLASLLHDSPRETAGALVLRTRRNFESSPLPGGLETEWPDIEDAAVESEPEFFAALSGLADELNGLFEELNVYRLVASYGKNTLTADRLLESRELFRELSEMARSPENFPLERRIMTVRRFLAVLKTFEEAGPPPVKPLALGLEYNFSNLSLAGLERPELRIFQRGEAGSFEGARYRVYERTSSVELQEEK